MFVLPRRTVLDRFFHRIPRSEINIYGRSGGTPIEYISSRPFRNANETFYGEVAPDGRKVAGV